eukprot:SAG31_NODE_14094_length_827_cov_2.236264_1_plen_240_part_10
MVTHSIAAQLPQVAAASSVLERLQQEALATTTLAHIDEISIEPGQLLSAASDSDSDGEQNGQYLFLDSDDEDEELEKEKLSCFQKFRLGGFIALWSAKLRDLGNDPKRMRLLFFLSAVLQLLLYIIIIVIQERTEDDGLCLVLLLGGSVLLGLQSGQAIEYFKADNQVRFQENLLYKQTKRLAFHSKMMLYPQLVINTYMVVFWCCIHSVVLYYRDCASCACMNPAHLHCACTTSCSCLM